MIRTNLVHIRVWGEFACFTRPEMKVERVSYPLCTPSAARGILEAIFWEPQMSYLIDSIAVVRRGRWFSFRRNEVSAVISEPAARSWMAGKTPVKFIEAGGGASDAAQRNMLALLDVEYIVSAEVRLTHRAAEGRDNVAKYSDEIRRRAARGKCAHRPALGCREFAADFDLVEDPSCVHRAQWPIEDLGMMLYDVFDPQARIGASDRSPNVRPGASFFHARVEDAVMHCHPDRVKIVRAQARENH